MEIITIDSNRPQPCVAAIGFFDGVHNGHKYLIEQVKKKAKESNMKSALITFAVHPRKVFKPKEPMPMLNTKTERLGLLDKQGVDYCFLLNFDMELARKTAREFMENVLFAQFNVRALVIGYDHRFGHNRNEGFEDYVEYGKQIGIEVIKSEEFRFSNGEVMDEQVSSSKAREYITEGDVEAVQNLLGYKYRLSGVVVDGHKIGRQIGFPTANIKPDCTDKIIPKDGIYAVWVYLRGERLRGMLSIGVRPTLNNGSDKSIEVYILDFDEQIYGEHIEVEFVKRTRDEEKYDNLDMLVEQLKRDVEEGRRILV